MAKPRDAYIVRLAVRIATGKPLCPCADEETIERAREFLNSAGIRIPGTEVMARGA